MLRRFTCLLFLVSAIGAGFASAADPQQETRLDRPVHVRMPYLLALPEGYEADAGKEWPLLLFLHGAGERGDDLELVKTHGPPKLIAAGKSLPFVVVSPQCPQDRWWNAFELNALLDEIVEKHRVDEDRVYVTGLSMGGFGTWSLAAFVPERLAAIAPICGGGETYWAKRYGDLPVWAFHGALDKGVPPERSQEMVDAVEKADGDAKLTVYPDAGHDSWTRTYENDAFYEWLLEQRRE